MLFTNLFCRVILNVICKFILQSNLTFSRLLQIHNLLSSLVVRTNLEQLCSPLLSVSYFVVLDIVNSEILVCCAELLQVACALLRLRLDLVDKLLVVRKRKTNLQVRVDSMVEVSLLEESINSSVVELLCNLTVDVGSLLQSSLLGSLVCSSL